jgi:hypothetical protein
MYNSNVNFYIFLEIKFSSFVLSCLKSQARTPNFNDKFVEKCYFISHFQKL